MSTAVMSLDLVCPNCKHKSKPIRHDKRTNTWWHGCGWSERAETNPSKMVTE